MEEARGDRTGLQLLLWLLTGATTVVINPYAAGG